MSMSATDSAPILRNQALMDANANVYKNRWLVATAAIIIYDFSKVPSQVCDNPANLCSSAYVWQGGK